LLGFERPDAGDKGALDGAGAATNTGLFISVVTQAAAFSMPSRVLGKDFWPMGRPWPEPIAAQSDLSFATSVPKNTVIELPPLRMPLALINFVNAGLPVVGCL
jgi:hypothetical protein